MESTRPMDRLLVGDVGYGKTEIAVRAAFKAVQSGRQVAVLVPTTILADQHLRTFTERLADFPMRVAALSRFQNAKEQAAIARRAEGEEGRHRHRHAPAAQPRRRVRRSRPDRRRRRASLRREAQGAAQAAQAADGRAHAHGDADSAHAASLARRPARHDADADAAARPVAGAHVRRAVGRRPDRRRHLARARSRRPGVLRPQPHRDDSGDRRPHQARSCRARAIGVAHGQMRERELEDVHARVRERRRSTCSCRR